MNLNDYFPTTKIINLSDLYLTRIEHEKDVRRLLRRCHKLNGAIYILSFGIGLLGAMIYEDRKRIYAMEKEKDETAG